MELGIIVGLFAVNITVTVWFFGRIDNDMKALATDMKEIAAEAKADSRALNARVDLMNTRIDTTQDVLLGMLERLGSKP